MAKKDLGTGAKRFSGVNACTGGQLGQNCRMRFCLPLILWAAAAAPAWASHAYALWGEPRYAADFKHFAYANPEAPKGGELRLVSALRYSTFDKYNPFTIKGSPPAYMAEMLFDSLLIASLDETTTGYGLLAEDIDVAADGMSATFKMRKAARFHNGKPVLAQDVKHSYEALISQYAAPGYKTLLADVEGCDVIDDRTVRFRFKKPNRDLPLTVGSLPVFSRDWGLGADGKPKRFDQIVTDMPIGSGPYKIGPVVFGRDITYVRDPDYWAKDLPVRLGSANFDRVTIKIYKDNTAKLEALKAGEFDVMRFFSAGDWARRLYGKRFDRGELRKGDFANKLPSGFQSYFLNLRRPLLQDVRVREALGLAFDYEWMQRQLFYGAYERVHGLFGNTMCETHGSPSDAELALLKPFEKDLPAGTLGPLQDPPRTDQGSSLRDNLRKAQALLADAGWKVDTNGVLRNAKGQALELEFLDSNEGGIRTVSTWMRNLEKLGIKLRLRVADYALYQQRVDKFDYDLISVNVPGTNIPGQEYAELFGSAAAEQEGSGNFIGLKSPAVDAMIAQMASAKSEQELLPACHALERIIVAGHYLIPQWYAASHRVVYDAWRLVEPPQVPAYVPGETWLMYYWWARMPPITADTAKP